MIDNEDERAYTRNILQGVLNVKEPARYDPVSTRMVEIYCRTRYDGHVTAPPRQTRLSGERIRSTLQACGFESTLVHSGSSLFRLSHGKIGQPDYVVVEVSPTTRPETARVNNGEPIIVPEEVYHWVTLVWTTETFLRSMYGRTPDTADMEIPPIIDVAVMALRAASDEP